MCVCVCIQHYTNRRDAMQQYANLMYKAMPSLVSDAVFNGFYNGR